MKVLFCFILNSLYQISNALLFLTMFLVVTFTDLFPQQYSYDDNWGTQGFTVTESTTSSLIVNFSVTEFSLDDLLVEGKNLKTVHMPEVFLPNDAGAPDLPGTGRYIAIPKNAIISFRIIDSRLDIIQNVEIAPAFEIPLDSDNGPLRYPKNDTFYSMHSTHQNLSSFLNKLLSVA
jgi:hypothetical protein